MCGVAGIINFKSSETKIDLMKKMLGFLYHRGPDASGIFVNGPVALGHTRLSIIDLHNGDQPIHNEDHSIWIVFNGEIFNYSELCEDLTLKGHKFYTQTDTEVIIHLYEEYHTELFQYLNGQFAFAIWDQKKNKLLLGRDRVGIRPLFYHHDNRRLLFGSEIKALFADDTLSRHIDPQNISDIFTCWSAVDSRTSFKGIHQLPAGSYAEFSENGLTITPYWDLTFPTEYSHDKPISEWVEELTQLILDSTKIRLRADVDVGAYLSGGIDSTFISSIVKHHFNNRLCTFSVGFEDELFDESSFQMKAVDFLKTDHKLIQCTYKNIGESFPTVIWHTETPIIRTAPAPLMQLSHLVKNSGYKVVLTGEGADEIFAGYNIFRECKVRRFWAREPESQLRPKLLQKLYPYIFTNQNRKTRKIIEQFFRKDFENVDLPVYSHLLRWQNTSHLKDFFSEEFRLQTRELEQFAEDYISKLPGAFMTWDPLSRAQYIENKIFLSNYLLSSQGDRMAMANSVEGRYPFLDYRIIEFATTIPPRYRMRGINEKYILKKSARGHIPDELIERPKQPYRAPIGQAFLGEFHFDYVDELFSENAIKKTGVFEPNKVAKLINKFRQHNGKILSERENMAIVGILSTQLVDQLFIKEFPIKPLHTLNDTKVITQ